MSGATIILVATVSVFVRTSVKIGGLKIDHNEAVMSES